MDKEEKRNSEKLEDAAYRYVEKLKPDLVLSDGAFLYYGHKIREAFIAGADYEYFR